MTASPDRAKGAARLMIEEATQGLEDPAAIVDALTLTLTDLNSLMATVVGPLGYRAVVTRALHVARRRDAIWSTVAIVEGPPTVLSGLNEAAAELGVDAVRSGIVELLADVIRLHCSFIGEDLTFRLLRRVWPLIPEEDAGSGTEEA